MRYVVFEDKLRMKPRRIMSGPDKSQQHIKMFQSLRCHRVAQGTLSADCIRRLKENVRRAGKQGYLAVAIGLRK